MKSGVLFINLGTPDDTSPESVGRYLKQFLMDPLVVDIPYLLRWFLVHILIVPRRKHKSAEAYKQIWSSKGSPLLFHSVALVEKMKANLKGPCELGMRYGSPSIERAMQKLRDQGVEKLTVIPLYPQYALSSTESSIVEVERVLKTLRWKVETAYLKDFFARDEFVQPLALKIEETVDLSKTDKLVMSFHGLPARHVQKLAGPAAKCYLDKNCCDRVTTENRWCYRAQCFATARKIAARLGLSDDKYIVTFQSRLGQREWIKPYTDLEIPRIVREGAKSIAVVCPAFVSDCLETVEEIGIRAKKDFITAGGKDFTYIPCLNDDDEWVNGLTKIISGFESQATNPAN